MKKTFTWKIWLTLFLSGLSYAIIYSIPYIKYVFYDAMAEATGGTNTQLGLAMSIYGAGNLISILIGGFVVDKFNYKTCILLSLVGTALLCAWLAVAPNINNVYIIWGLLIITTLFVFDPAIFKITRMIVPEDQVSRSVGYFTMFQSIGYMLVNFLGLYVYDRTSVTAGIAQGFCNVIWLYGGMLVVTAVLCIFLFRKVEDVNVSKTGENDFTWGNIKKVLKNPALWMMTVIGICIYTTSLTASYFTPYFTSVLGVTITMAGVLGLFKQYGGRLFTPIFGEWAHRSKYVSRIIIFGLTAILALLIMVLVLPSGTPAWILIVISLAMGAFATMFMNLALALPTEGGIPRGFTGVAMGIYSAIAYAPDMYQHALYGHWLDKYGNAGYTRMFIYDAVFTCVGIIAAVMLYRLAKKRAAEAQEQLEA